MEELIKPFKVKVDRTTGWEFGLLAKVGQSCSCLHRQPVFFEASAGS